MQFPKLPALVALTAYLNMGVLANYEQNKATQINFYKDNTCSTYSGEMAFWHSGNSPLTGYETRFNGDSEGDCFEFSQPADTTYLNLASCWDPDGNTMAPSWCDCYFFDQAGCQGESAHSYGNCVTADNGQGNAWQSAKCYVLTDPPSGDSTNIPRL